MMYLEEDVRAWAGAGISKIDDSVVHKDSNGVILNAGDTVTIIKRFRGKGAGFTAKRGTAVRNISLTSNPDQIEGRVNGVKIVLLTQYLKNLNIKERLNLLFLSFLNLFFFLSTALSCFLQTLFYLYLSLDIALLNI